MKNILTLSIIALLLFSCSKDDNDSNKTSSYEGNWSGTFEGTYYIGTWLVNINSKGEVNGSGTSTFYNSTFQLEGNVNDSGEYKAIFNTTRNTNFGPISVYGEFKGQLSGKSATGYWTQHSSGDGGYWVGDKQ
jgi:hypothetical protein